MKNIQGPYLKHDVAIKMVLELLKEGPKSTSELATKMGKTRVTIRDYLIYNKKVTISKIKNKNYYSLKED